jgi:hypothetical protein
LDDDSSKNSLEIIKKMGCEEAEQKENRCRSHPTEVKSCTPPQKTKRIKKDPKEAKEAKDGKE